MDFHSVMSVVGKSLALTSIKIVNLGGHRLFPVLDIAAFGLEVLKFISEFFVACVLSFLKQAAVSMERHTKGRQWLEDSEVQDLDSDKEATSKDKLQIRIFLFNVLPI